MAAANEKKVIALFDVDGTLTPARKEVSPEVLEFLVSLRNKITIGFVGGSDLKKQLEQMGPNGDIYLHIFYTFFFKKCI